jgi:hypothetical protein
MSELKLNSLLFEAPYGQYSVFMDFKVEMLQGLSKEQKEALISSFNNTDVGFAGYSKLLNKWLHFTKEDISIVNSSSEIGEEVPRLPEDWEATLLLDISSE